MIRCSLRRTLQAVLVLWAISVITLGRVAIDAVLGIDLPVIMAITLLSAFFVVLANLVVDVLYAAIDPRVRPS